VLRISKIFMLFMITSLSLSAQIKLVHRTNDWATHQPVLCEMAARTEGAIIEFGTGDNSTALLHEICKATNRTLISLDDDLMWINKYKERYRGDGYEEDNSGWHKFYFVPGKVKENYNFVSSHWARFLDEFSLLDTLYIDLAFVDQSPWIARMETVNKIKDKVRFVIVHDCDCLATHLLPLGITIRSIDAKNQTPGVFDFSSTFENFKVFFPLHPWPGMSGPPTLLGSNFEEVPDVNYEEY